MNKVFDVFISYRRSDGSDLAQQLFFYLSRKGIRAFLDKEKLMNGTYFDTQLREKLISAPHYVLIGTTDAFCDREGEDWVKEEIELAIEEYDRSEAIEPGERTITVIHPHDAVFPDSLHSDKLDKILKVQRIEIPYGHDSTDAFAAVFDVVTKVSKRNLWHSAQRWYESSKKSGGRFARLHIEESIIPKAGDFMRRGEMPVNVNIDEKNGDEAPLLDAINATGEHLFLIGQGGIGKTTSLMKIMDDAYADRPFSDERQVPIFVELSYAPDNDGRYYEQGKSSFIRRSIFKQIRDRGIDNQAVMNAVDEMDNAFSILSETAVLPINRMFTKKTERPEYLLLLDGLNEVSTAKIKNNDNTVIDLIRREIRYLINECPNVRVILTSRSDDACGYFNELKRLYLSGVDENSIRNYFTDCEMSQKQIEAAISDEKLKDALKIPLFLTMYATLKNNDRICTQGEILRCFFHERRENIGVYTVQDRIACVGENAASSAPVMEEARLTAEMQNYIIDLILPEIGRYMEKNGEFHIPRKVLREIISKVLDGREDTDLCGICGDDVFKISNRHGVLRESSIIADEIKERFANNKNRITASMIECLVYSLGILQMNTEESGYGFMHQHIRDYFAAVSYINAMRLAGYLYQNGEKADALSVMNERFKDKPIGLQVRRFIGEVLGEHHNAPYYDNGWKQNTSKNDPLSGLITRTLNIYRRIHRNDGGYGVYSLVHILNETRGELSGIDFSEIDFTGCSLNGMRLSRKGLEARFDQSVLGFRELAYLGHTDIINSAIFSPDGCSILTASRDGTIKAWDAESLELIGEIKAYSGYSVLTVGFSQDGKRIITTSGECSHDSDATAKILDSISLQICGTLYNRGWITSASFSPDGHRIATNSHSTNVDIWDAQSLSIISTFKAHSKLVDSVLFSHDGRLLVTVSFLENNVKIWDSQHLTLLYTIEGGNDVTFDPDGNMIAVTLFGAVEIRNAQTFSLLGKLEEHNGWIDGVSFSPDGSRITTSSENTIKIWDAFSFDLLYTCHGSYSVKGYSPDGSKLLAVNGSQLILLDPKSFSQIGIIKGERVQVSLASYIPVNNRFITNSGKTLKVWDARNNTLLDTLSGYLCFENSPSPDGSMLVTRYAAENSKVWNINNGICPITLRDANWANSAFFSHDSCKIVTSHMKDNTAKIWRAKDCSLLGVLVGHTSQVEYASFSQDCLRIVTASRDNTAKIWDAQNALLLGTLKGHRGTVKTAVFSPDGTQIVTASHDNTVMFWDANTFERLNTLVGHTNMVNSAFFSPDGTKLITASCDATAKIWDVKSSALIVSLEGHSRNVYVASYSIHGNRIITEDVSGTVNIWDAADYALLATFNCPFSKVDKNSFNKDDSTVILPASNGTIEIWDATTFKRLYTIPNRPGIVLVGVDLTKLDSRSQFSNDEKELLRTYGANI